MTIGDRIRRKREELGMSQEELAHKIGYKNKSSINKIEMDVQQLTQKKIVAVANALGVSVNYILGIDEPDKVQKTGQEEGYYINDETAKVAQEIFDDPDLRALFSAARDVKPDDLKMAAEMLRRFKEGST